MVEKRNLFLSKILAKSKIARIFIGENFSSLYFIKNIHPGINQRKKYDGLHIFTEHLGETFAKIHPQKIKKLFGKGFHNNLTKIEIETFIKLHNMCSKSFDKFSPINTIFERDLYEDLGIAFNDYASLCEMYNKKTAWNIAERKKIEKNKTC